jgi:hypothetical protein
VLQIVLDQTRPDFDDAKAAHMPIVVEQKVNRGSHDRSLRRDLARAFTAENLALRSEAGPRHRINATAA